MAKDFSGIDTGRNATGGVVYEKLEQGTGKGGQQGTASPQEQHQRRQEGRTQGRKGCRVKRLNLAFYEGNYEFIRVMSKATGRTMTQFTNLIIEAYRNEHPEMMQQAQAFLDTVNSGAFSKLTENQE